MVCLYILTVLAYPAYLMGVNDMLLKEKLTRYEVTGESSEVIM